MLSKNSLGRGGARADAVHRGRPEPGIPTLASLSMRKFALQVPGLGQHQLQFRPGRPAQYATAQCAAVSTRGILSAYNRPQFTIAIALKVHNAAPSRENVLARPRRRRKPLRRFRTTRG